MTYRTQEHCHINWCDEGKDHEGWHYGESEPEGNGQVSMRTAPPNAGNKDTIHCHTISLSPEMKKALDMKSSSLSGFHKKPSLLKRIFFWVKSLFKNSPHTII